MEPLRLDKLVLAFEIRDALFHFRHDFPDGALHFFTGRHVVRRGVDGDVRQRPCRRASDDVDFADPVDLVAEKLNPYGAVARVGGVDFDRVAPDAERIALERQIVAPVSDFDELL